MKKTSLCLALLLWLGGASLAGAKVMGDLGHFTPQEIERLERSAGFLEQESRTPVCVIVADNKARFVQFAQQCQDAIVLGAVVEKQELVMDVPGNSPLVKKLDKDTARAIKNGDILPLLRKGKGADGLINGLEGLVLVMKGRYAPQPPGWLRYTWPLILVATIAVLLLIARQGQGLGRGAGLVITAGGWRNDLNLASSPSGVLDPEIDRRFPHEQREEVRALLAGCQGASVYARPALPGEPEAAAKEAFEVLRVPKDGGLLILMDMRKKLAIAAHGSGNNAPVDIRRFEWKESPASAVRMVLESLG